MPNFVRSYRSLLLWLAGMAALLLVLAPTYSHAQGFGSTKKKIVLHRKLPASVHLSGDSFTITVTSHGIQEDIGIDLKSMLATELMKNDARLREEDKGGDTQILCTITQYSQPKPSTSSESTYEVGSKKPVNETITRYTGLLTVAYQAKDRHSGRTLDSQNVTAKFDDEFNQNGSTKGGVTSAFSNTFKRLKNGKSEADTPPTDAELRNKLLKDVVSQISSRLVNTDETIEVLLARGKLDEADKEAEAGLWSRYLEAMETMTPFPNKEDDAYRLYNIGVAYEALAYASEDPKAAKKDLQDAAINYGKAIDDKPAEKYFLTPQARIETAIAHYNKLATSSSGSVSASSGSIGGGGSSRSPGGCGRSSAPFCWRSSRPCSSAAASSCRSTPSGSTPLSRSWPPPGRTAIRFRRI